MSTWLASAVGIRVHLACALGIVLACAPALHARAAEPEASYAEARKAFQQAYARASAGSLTDTSSDDENLKSYPLFPYLQAERIARQLSRASISPEQTDRRAAQFLAAHEREPVARRLRSVWLENLAARAQWAPFLEAYRDSVASDRLRCQSYTARIALARTDGLAGELVREWLKPQRASPECELSFAWLRSNSAVTADLIERRARYALESSEPALARESIAELPPERAGPLAQWALLLEHPAQEIHRLILTPISPVEAAALRAGWARLAQLLFTWLSGAADLLRSNVWLTLIGPSSHASDSPRMADQGSRAVAGQRR
jgi:soluble lytic murein transglycosylase